MSTNKTTVASLNTIVVAQLETIQKLVDQVLDLKTRVERLETKLNPPKANLQQIFDTIGFTCQVSEETRVETDVDEKNNNWFISVTPGYYHENLQRMQQYIGLISRAARAAGHFTRIEREGNGRAVLRIGKYPMPRR